MKKIISIFLSVLMLISGISCAGITAQAAEKNSALSYQFDYKTKTLYVRGKGSIPANYLGWDAATEEDREDKLDHYEGAELSWKDSQGNTGNDYDHQICDDVALRQFYPDYYVDITRYVKHLVIGEGITAIGNNAFSESFPELETIQLPGSIREIGHCVFDGDNGDWIKSIVIPAGTETMGANAFLAENVVILGKKTKLSGNDYYGKTIYCPEGSRAITDIKNYNERAKKDAQKNTQKYKTVKTPSKVSGLKVKTGGNSASLSWSKAKNANQYQVQRYVSSKKKWITVATAKTNQYTVKNLSGSTNYKFRVRGVNNVYGGKFYGSYSKSVSAKTKLGKVSGVKLSSKSGKLTVKWSKEKEAKDYHVYYATKKDGSYKKLTTTSKTSCTKKLTKGKTYYVKVRARKKNASGKYTYGAFSQIKSIKMK